MSLLKYVHYCGLNVIGSCFKSRRGFIPGPVSEGGTGENGLEEHSVCLDTSYMGINLFLSLSL